MRIGAGRSQDYLFEYLALIPLVNYHENWVYTSKYKCTGTCNKNVSIPYKLMQMTLEI